MTQKSHIVSDTSQSLHMEFSLIHNLKEVQITVLNAHAHTQGVQKRVLRLQSLQLETAY